MLKMIVAVDDNWGIGKDNQLLFHIPEDMRFFKDMTSGHAVVMGHKTYDSIGRPLPNRENYVLTRNWNLSIDNVHVIHDIDDIPKDAFIIGGQSLYEKMLPYCDIVYVTKIHQTKDCDRHFPNLDRKLDWETTKTQLVETKNDGFIEFVTYERPNK